MPKVLPSYVKCPQCGGRVPLSGSVFREDFHCIRCEAPLHVSVWYTRCLVLLSGAVALVPLWVVISDLWAVILFILVSFVILSVLVRTVIFVIPPPLRVGDIFAGFSTFTTLDLKAESKAPFSQDR